MTDSRSRWLVGSSKIARSTEPTRVEPMWLLMVGVVGANAFAEATTNEENNRATWAMQAVRLGG